MRVDLVISPVYPECQCGRVTALPSLDAEVDLPGPQEPVWLELHFVGSRWDVCTTHGADRLDASVVETASEAAVQAANAVDPATWLARAREALARQRAQTAAEYHALVERDVTQRGLPRPDTLRTKLRRLDCEIAALDLADPTVAGIARRLLRDDWTGTPTELVATAEVIAEALAG